MKAFIKKAIEYSLRGRKVNYEAMKEYIYNNTDDKRYKLFIKASTAQEVSGILQYKNARFYYYVDNTNNVQIENI